jgi:pyrroline-5-carboxylate reductase
MKIGVIGLGTIATAVVHGIAKDGHQITVSQRSEQHATALSEAYDCLAVAENQQVLDQSDVIFLGLMAGAAPDILNGLNFRSGQQVISFMADVSLAEVAEMIAPATASAIMMPFPGIATGGTPIMMLGDAALVDSIFGARNTLYPLRDDAELQAYICAQAVLSPVAQMVSSVADWAATKGAGREQSEAFLRQLIASSLAASDSDSLVQALSTPGGYNLRLRERMQASGLEESLKRGLDDLA